MKRKKRNTRKRAVKRYEGNLRRKYELTPEDFVRILLYQQRRCAVCGRSREELGQDLCVDHDHSTGVVRGLLCKSCNRLLGIINDSVAWCEAARGYLISPPAPKVLRDLRG